jgi:hypothetical protein
MPHVEIPQAEFKVSDQATADSCSLPLFAAARVDAGLASLQMLTQLCFGR